MSKEWNGSSVSNAHSLLKIILYEYIHGTTKSRGKSEVDSFQSHADTFIYIGDMLDWFFNSHPKHFSLEMLCLELTVIVERGTGLVWDRLTYGEVINLCFIIKMFVLFYFFFLFFFVMSVWYSCIGLGWGGRNQDWFHILPTAAARAKLFSEACTAILAADIIFHVSFFHVL